MRDVLDRTDGQLRLWPATLYGTLDDLAGEELIEELDETETAEPLRRAVSTIDPELPLFAVRDLDCLLSGEFDLNRLGMILLALPAGTPAPPRCP